MACGDEGAHRAGPHAVSRRSCPGVSEMGADEHDGAFVGEIDKTEGGEEKFFGGAVESTASVHFGTSEKGRLGTDLE